MEATSVNIISPIVVVTSTGTYFFQPEEIVRLEACSNYTFIHLVDHQRVFTAKVLKRFESVLAPFGFIRTHKTHLVNRLYISHITTEGKVHMKDSSVVEISRRKRKYVRSLLIYSARSA